MYSQKRRSHWLLMLFITSLKHTVSNFLFPIAVCLFYFFQNFLFRPLSTELFTKNKKYLIFIQKIAQRHQYYIGASMTKTINPEYKLINKICTFECYVKFSFWVSVYIKPAATPSKDENIKRRDGIKDMSSPDKFHKTPKKMTDVRDV